ncbi:MAG TPA: trypsin-like serine protease [Thermoanaerobaculia bacterium]|jgi:hypothetical protein|nr:trypsin-like serine protease [Thermoanaerobaculia bacterium]
MAEEDVRIALARLTGGPGQRAKGDGRLRAAAAEAAAALPLEQQPWVWSNGIAGLGVAEKEVSGKRLSEVVLKVYVEKKLPQSRVEVPVPKVVQLEGLPPIDTDVVEIGKVELQSNTARVRPAIPGYSVGRAVDTMEAGTFGLVVRKKGQATPLYLLSNSHAIANSGFGAVGDVIIQPGGYDGGTAPNDAIGTLTAWIPFVFSATGFQNLVDAAIAELDPDIASAAIAQIGVPTGVSAKLERGQIVQKMGRTTTLSVARVDDVDLRVPSTYPNPNLPGGVGRVGFSDQVLVTFYSSGGDSGSPVLNMNKEVVGLHVAGSPVIGIFCKIQNIMDLLGIEPVTTRNQGAGPAAGGSAPAAAS